MPRLVHKNPPAARADGGIQPQPNDRHFKMSLTAKDKSAVKEFWAKVSNKAEDIGTDALSR